MKIYANQLPSALKKNLLRCYLVTGDEPLLVRESLDAIRAAARQQGFDARELHIAGPAFDWSELRAAAGSLSLFAERRILELQLPTGKPGRDGALEIADLVPKTGDDLLLVVSAPKLDISAKWVKTIDSVGGLVQVWPVDRRELPQWIEGRMRREGLMPDRNAVRLIADRVEGNLLAAEQEIEKLRLLLGEGPVSGDEVEDAVADSSRFDIFKLVDAAVAGDAARAVRILGGIRDEGVDAAVVLWALTRELRTLARLADSVTSGVDLGAALKKARVWSKRQPIVRACVSRHGPSDFHHLLRISHQADKAVRGQLPVNPWQLATEITIGLALGRAMAA